MLVMRPIAAEAALAEKIGGKLAIIVILGPTGLIELATGTAEVEAEVERRIAAGAGQERKDSKAPTPPTKPSTHTAMNAAIAAAPW